MEAGTKVDGATLASDRLVGVLSSSHCVSWIDTALACVRLVVVVSVNVVAGR